MTPKELMGKTFQEGTVRKSWMKGKKLAVYMNGGWFHIGDNNIGPRKMEDGGTLEEGKEKMNPFAKALNSINTESLANVNALPKQEKGWEIAKSLTPALSVIPGIGPLAAAGIGAALPLMQNIFQKKPTNVKSLPKVNPFTGQQQMAMGGNFQQWNAPSHDQGGMMVDRGGLPTDNPQNAIAEIEKGENMMSTPEGKYVFSDNLTDPQTGMTMAQKASEIQNKYKNKRDDLSKNALRLKMEELKKKNEKFKQEAQALVDAQLQSKMNQDAMQMPGMEQQGMQQQGMQPQMSAPQQGGMEQMLPQMGGMPQMQYGGMMVSTRGGIPKMFNGGIPPLPRRDMQVKYNQGKENLPNWLNPTPPQASYTISPTGNTPTTITPPTSGKTTITPTNSKTTISPTGNTPITITPTDGKTTITPTGSIPPATTPTNNRTTITPTNGKTTITPINGKTTITPQGISSQQPRTTIKPNADGTPVTLTPDTTVTPTGITSEMTDDKKSSKVKEKKEKEKKERRKYDQYEIATGIKLGALGLSAIDALLPAEKETLRLADYTAGDKAMRNLGVSPQSQLNELARAGAASRAQIEAGSRSFGQMAQRLNQVNATVGAKSAQAIAATKQFNDQMALTTAQREDNKALSRQKELIRTQTANSQNKANRRNAMRSVLSQATQLATSMQQLEYLKQQTKDASEKELMLLGQVTGYLNTVTPNVSLTPDLVSSMTEYVKYKESDPERSQKALEKIFTVSAMSGEQRKEFEKMAKSTEANMVNNNTTGTTGAASTTMLSGTTANNTLPNTSSKKKDQTVNNTETGMLALPKYDDDKSINSKFVSQAMGFTPMDDEKTNTSTQSTTSTRPSVSEIISKNLGFSKEEQGFVEKLADGIIDYEVTKGSKDGTGLPMYKDNPEKISMISHIYKKAKKLLNEDATPLEIAHTVDFMFNSSWDSSANDLGEFDPTAITLQEYYRKYDPSKLDKDGLLANRKKDKNKFIETYKNTVGKLDPEERLELITKGRHWFYKNINVKEDGSPSDAYENTWKERIEHINKMSFNK